MQEIKNLFITIFVTHLPGTKPIEISKVTKGRNFQVCADRKMVKTFFLRRLVDILNNSSIYDKVQKSKNKI